MLGGRLGRLRNLCTPFVAISQVSTCGISPANAFPMRRVAIVWASDEQMVLIDNAIQAMNERKSCPVETRLTDCGLD